MAQKFEIGKKNTSEMIFHQGDLFFQELIKDIKQAQKTIDVEMYIFQQDALGKELAQLFAQAQSSGIKVRILIDGAGSFDWGGELERILDEAGVEVRMYHPLPWNFKQWKRSHHGQHSFWGTFFHLWAAGNRHNHRKYVVIDKKIAWMGSFNISANHLSPPRGYNWRDSGMRLTDGRVLILSEFFKEIWSRKTAESWKKRHIHYPSVRMNTSFFLRRRLQREFFLKLLQAKEHIWITSPYFVPQRRLLRLLKRKAKHGVDVRLLLPNQSDVPFVVWVSQLFYPGLLKKGVRLYQYEKSILHAKVIMVDQWMMVGTSNMNHRSFLHDLELDIVVREESSRQELIQQFLQDLEVSQEIKLENLRKRSWWTYLLGRFFLLIKSWM